MSAYTTQRLVHRRKRVRFSGDDSSEPSISDESALVPTSVDSHSTEASDLESSESELSESSEEPSDESSSEEEEDGDDTEMEEQSQDGVVNLRANRGTKPVMRLNKEDLGPDIRDFLKDFLPQLKAANEELERQKKAGTLKSLDAEDAVGEEGAPYIEMDLGLGVLEAKDPNAPDSSSSESEESDSEEALKEKDVLGKLLGREKVQDTAGIQVVQDAPIS